MYPFPVLRAWFPGVVATLAIVTVASAEPQNKLTHAQMLSDFDQAIGFINDFAVHKDLNEKRFGINYPEEFQRLRTRLSARTTDCEFYDTVESALNLVQDLHASTMDYAYLSQYGQYQKKFNFDNTTTYAGVKYFDETCASEPPKLELPVIFTEGKYLIYADFRHDGHLIPRGTEIMTYNGQNIEQFILENLDTVWPVMKDDPDGTPYNKKFYTFGSSNFTLSLSDGRKIEMNLTEPLEFLVPQKRRIYYGSQSEPGVLYFEEGNILYVGIPMMHPEYAATINSRVDAIVNEGNPVDKVIIDIRGNAGGSDMTWRDIIAHLLKKDLTLTLNLKARYNESVVGHYSKDSPIEPVEVPLLDDKLYWTLNDNTLTLPANDGAIDYKGTIFLLQDEFIYSSAGNFSNFALLEERIVSVGRPTDLVGGGQIEPLFFQLNQSGMTFRIESVLDFAGVETLADFTHNKVEVSIPMTTEDYYLRTTYDGDVYGKEFLRVYDRLFQYVAEHK